MNKTIKFNLTLKELLKLDIFKDIVISIILFISALFIRSLFLIEPNMMNDDGNYMLSAVCIMDTSVMNYLKMYPAPFWWSTGWPIVGGVLMKIFPSDIYFLSQLNAIFGSLSVVLIYFFAKRVFNSSTVGLLSSALIIYQISHLFASVTSMSESITLLLILITFFIIFEIIKNNKGILIILFFISSSFLIMIRYESIVVLPIYFLVTFLGNKKGYLKNYILRWENIACLIILICQIPNFIFNKYHLGSYFTYGYLSGWSFIHSKNIKDIIVIFLNYCKGLCSSGFISIIFLPFVLFGIYFLRKKRIELSMLLVWFFCFWGLIIFVHPEHAACIRYFWKFAFPLLFLGSYGMYVIYCEIKSNTLKYIYTFLLIIFLFIPTQINGLYVISHLSSNKNGVDKENVNKHMCLQIYNPLFGYNIIFKKIIIKNE